MAESHTGDGVIDEQLATLPGLGEADEDDIEDLVDALTGHGPEESAVVMSETQAEALARRKFADQTRQETADAMDVSVWTVDSNLTRAKDNLETVDEAAMAFDSTGAFGLERVDIVGGYSVDDVEDDEAGDQDDDVDEEADEAEVWGRLMTREAVVEVNLPTSGEYVSVRIEDDDLEDVKTDLGELGYVRQNVRSHMNTTSVRAWVSGAGPGVDGGVETRGPGIESDVDDEADEEPVDGDERREVLLLGGVPVPAKTDGLDDDVLKEIKTDLESLVDIDLDDIEDGETLGAVEIDGDGFAFDPADELVDVDGDDEETEGDDVDESDESGVQNDDGEETDASPGGDEADDETDVYRCECGETFDSGSALGGHSRYCDGVDETNEESDDGDGGDEDVLEDGGGGGDDESGERQTATCDNCGYSGPRKGDAEEGEKAVVWFEDAWMCQECKFKDGRSSGGPSSGSRTSRRGGMGSGGLGRSQR